MAEKKRTLEELQADIRMQLRQKHTEYWHNIIGCTLRIIHDEYGEDAAIETMKNLHLDRHGWTIPKKD